MAATAVHTNHLNGISLNSLAPKNEINQASDQNSNPADGEDEENQKEVDIVINNVVCSFNVRCHLNLRDIALRGINVEYRKENGMVTMKLRQPYTTANIWNSGKITCTGANSEEQAKIAARRFARILQKLNFPTRFTNYRVVNVLGTVTLPFAIRITQFSQAHHEASYEPELHPGVTYKCKDPKATLKIFSTGSVTITAPSVANVQRAVEHIYPLVEVFQKPKTKQDKLEPLPKIPEKTKGEKRKMPSAPNSIAAPRPPPPSMRPNGNNPGSNPVSQNQNNSRSFQYVPKKRPVLQDDSDESDETDSD